MEIKPFKTPEVLFAKQYFDLGEQLSFLKKHAPRAGAKQPADTSVNQQSAIKSIETARARVRDRVVEFFIRPKLKNQNQRNIDESFNEWRLGWGALFVDIADANREKCTTTESIRRVLKLKEYEDTIDNMQWSFGEFGNCGRDSFELPKEYAKNMDIIDNTDEQWEKYDNPNNHHPILSQDDIDRLTRELLKGY